MLLQHLGRNIILLVSIYVTLGILCNPCVEWLITSYNTLITFRVTSGAMFLLTQNDQNALQCVVDQTWTLECFGLTI
jgi:hypothetical protein